MQNYKPVYQKMAGGKTVRIPGMMMGGATVSLDDKTPQEKAKRKHKRKKFFQNIGKGIKNVCKTVGDKEFCSK